jgi:uncharacterized protein (DUF697 family)/GTP-binding protein EngB required for normal cell division
VKPSILLCGQSGTGKSSIANFRLRDRLARVGDSEPVRNGFPPPRYENDKIVFYDCDGYETAKTAEYKTALFDFLGDKNGAGSVHLAWYTINAAGHRLTDFDLEIIGEMERRGFPSAVLLTKVDECSEDELRDFCGQLKAETKNTGIFRVCTKTETSSQQYVQEHFCDWDALVAWTETEWNRVTEKRLKKELQSLEKAKKSAQGAVIAATAAAAGVGISPIPFSDAALLIPVQIGMILGIAGFFKINVAKAVISAVVGPIITTALGRGLVGNLLKFIPGIVTVAGAAINGSTAGILTAAIGNGFIALCHNYRENEITGRGNEKPFEDTFKSASFMGAVLGDFKKKKG